MKFEDMDRETRFRFVNGLIAKIRDDVKEAGANIILIAVPPVPENEEVEIGQSVMSSNMGEEMARYIMMLASTKDWKDK